MWVHQQARQTQAKQHPAARMWSAGQQSEALLPYAENFRWQPLQGPVWA